MNVRRLGQPENNHIVCGIYTDESKRENVGRPGAAA